MCTHAHRLIKNEIVSKIWHFLSSCYSIFNHTLFKRNSTLAYFTFSEMCQLVWISNIWFCTKQPECLICFWVSIFMTVFLWLWSREIFFQGFSRWNYVSGLYCQIYPTVLVLWLNCLKLDPYFFVVVDVRYHNMTHFCGLWLASSSSSFEKLPGRQPLKQTSFFSESSQLKSFLFSFSSSLSSWWRMMTDDDRWWQMMITYLRKCHRRATSRWCRRMSGLSRPVQPGGWMWSWCWLTLLWNIFKNIIRMMIMMMMISTLGSWRSAHTLHQNLVFINSPVPFHWDGGEYFQFWNRLNLFHVGDTLHRHHHYTFSVLLGNSTFSHFNQRQKWSN